MLDRFFTRIHTRTNSTITVDGAVIDTTDMVDHALSCFEPKMIVVTHRPTTEEFIILVTPGGIDDIFQVEDTIYTAYTGVNSAIFTQGGAHCPIMTSDHFHEEDSHFGQRWLLRQLTGWIHIVMNYEPQTTVTSG